MIQNTQHSQNLNFGWNGVTHQAITRKAAEKINKINRKSHVAYQLNVKALVDACTLPDKIHKNTPHIADIDNRQMIDGVTMFEKFNKQAGKDLKSGNKKQFWINIGKALHYLQDITNPEHVQGKKTKQSIQQKIRHKSFEDIAVKLQKEVLQNTTTTFKDNEKSMDDYIKSKMRETKDIKKVMDFRRPKLSKSIPSAIRNSYDISINYLADIVTKYGFPE